MRHLPDLDTVAHYGGSGFFKNPVPAISDGELMYPFLEIREIEPGPVLILREGAR